MIELETLKNAALAATSGEWEIHYRFSYVVQNLLGHSIASANQGTADAAWIVASQPKNILPLIERLKTAEADAARFLFLAKENEKLNGFSIEQSRLEIDAEMAEMKEHGL